MRTILDQPCLVLRASWAILIPSLWGEAGRYHFPHLTDEKTEALKGGLVRDRATAKVLSQNLVKDIRAQSTCLKQLLTQPWSQQLSWRKEGRVRRLYPKSGPLETGMSVPLAIGENRGVPRPRLRHTPQPPLPHRRPWPIRVSKDFPRP